MGEPQAGPRPDGACYFVLLEDTLLDGKTPLPKPEEVECIFYLNA